MGAEVDDDHLFGLVPVAIRARARRRRPTRPRRSADDRPGQHPWLLGPLPGGASPRDRPARARRARGRRSAPPARTDPSSTRATRPPVARPATGSATTCSSGSATATAPFMDVDVRLARMDERGIDLQVLSPNPLTFLHHVDAGPAVGVRRAPQRRPGRAGGAGTRTGCGGLAQLPHAGPRGGRPRSCAAPVTELGLLGAYVGTDLGRPLDDPAFDVVYRACVELDVPLFVHPAPAASTGPAATSGSPASTPTCGWGSPTRRRWPSPPWCWAACSPATPALDVCISHGGGATSWLAERMAHAARTRAVGRRRDRARTARSRPGSRGSGGTPTSAGRRALARAPRRLRARPAGRRHQLRRLGRGHRPERRRRRRSPPPWTPTPADSSASTPLAVDRRRSGYTPVSWATQGCTQNGIWGS